MQDSQANPKVSNPQSAHAQQLARGFPWLRFEPVLEQEFQQQFREDSWPQIRRNLWIAVLFVAAISVLTHMIMDTEVNRRVDNIRLAVLAPILVLGLLITYSK